MTNCQERGTNKVGKALWMVCPFSFNGLVRPRGYIVFYEDGTRIGVDVGAFTARFYMTPNDSHIASARTVGVRGPR